MCPDLSAIFRSSSALVHHCCMQTCNGVQGEHWEEPNSASMQALKLAVGSGASPPPADVAPLPGPHLERFFRRRGPCTHSIVLLQRNAGAASVCRRVLPAAELRLFALHVQTVRLHAIQQPSDARDRCVLAPAGHHRTPMLCRLVWAGQRRRCATALQFLGFLNETAQNWLTWHMECRPNKWAPYIGRGAFAAATPAPCTPLQGGAWGEGGEARECLGLIPDSIVQITPSSN